jgi:hypothetical protein
MRVLFTVLIILTMTIGQAHAEVVDVLIKGLDDGVKTTKQHDYEEAVMNAKIQAIERAGTEIESVMRVVNFQMKYKAVESKAKAVLKPGFQVMDIGYLPDGTYQIVLSGKVVVGKEKLVQENQDQKDLRYAILLMDNKKPAKARKIIDRLLSSTNHSVKANAMYYSILWGFATNDREYVEKLKAYYPDFDRLSQIESIVKKREEEESRRRGEAEKKRVHRQRIKAEKKRIEAEKKRIEAELRKRRKAEEAERQRVIEEERLTEARNKYERLKPRWGDLAAGHGQQFILFSEGILVDTDNHREWYVGGVGRGMTYAEAASWIKNLDFDGGRWEMPTADMLKELPDIKRIGYHRDYHCVSDLPGWRNLVSPKTCARPFWTKDYHTPPASYNQEASEYTIGPAMNRGYDIILTESKIHVLPVRQSREY